MAKRSLRAVIIVAFVIVAGYYVVLPLFESRDNPKIKVEAATYGANCKAPRGNATADLQKKCQGRAACSYTVNVAELGDPAPNCAKDYAAEYTCVGSTQVQKVSAPPEAGLGAVVQLNCSPPRPTAGTPAR
jgi:hypothetical protein